MHSLGTLGTSRHVEICINSLGKALLKSMLIMFES